MDTGVTGGIFSNPEVGIIKGAEIGIIPGYSNGVFNENLRPDAIVQDKLILNLDASNRTSYPGSGGTWKDLSGNGYNATVQTGVSYNSTIRGNLKTAAVANSAILLPVNTIWDFGTSDFSICMWVKAEGGEFIRYDTAITGGLWWVYSNGHSGSSYSMNFLYWNSNRVTSRQLGVTLTDIPIGGWLYVAGTRRYGSTADSGPRLYINGLLKGSILGSDTLNVVAQSGAYPGIGRAGSFAQYSAVTVSMVSIYKKELSADEVMQNYNATKYRFNSQ